MKRYIWRIALAIAAVLWVVCIVAIIIALGMKPGSDGVLAMAVTGMGCGVLASAFGAIAWSTYMPPWERAEHKAAHARPRGTKP